MDTDASRRSVNFFHAGVSRGSSARVCALPPACAVRVRDGDVAEGTVTLREEGRSVVLSRHASPHALLALSHLGQIAAHDFEFAGQSRSLKLGDGLPKVLLRRCRITAVTAE